MTIHLNLLGKWFDMVYRGIKREEYRSITEYWIKRLMKDGKLVNIEKIIFSNGYSKNRRQFTIECKSLKISRGVPEWGAAPGEKYFTFHLGEIVQKNF